MEEENNVTEESIEYSPGGKNMQLHRLDTVDENELEERISIMSNT